MKFPADALLTLASHPHCWLLGQTIQPEEATTQPTYATRWEERHGTSQDRTSAPSCPPPAALAQRGDHPTAEPLPSPPTHAPSRPQGIWQMPSPGIHRHRLASRHTQFFDSEHVISGGGKAELGVLSGPHQPSSHEPHWVFQIPKGFISQLSPRTGQACFLCCVCAWLRRKHLDVREPV